MTDTLETDIRSTLAVMVAEAPDPLSFDDLALQSLSPAQPQSRWSSGKSLAAAFAGVVVAVGAVAFLLGPFDGGVGPAGQTPTTTTPPPEALAPTSWSRIPHDALVFGDARMVSVVVSGPGLVAVGSAPSNSDALGVDGVAAVWTSNDGIAWSRVPHDEAVFGREGDQTMTSVIVGGPGLVAFGQDDGSGGIYAVWTSIDGLRWSRVPQDEVIFGGLVFGRGGPNDVILGAMGMVAVGEVASAAAVWTSADGSIWSRVPHDEAVFGLRLGDGNGMTGVTMGGPGLVAVGSDGLNSDAPTGRARAVVWTSIDGLVWSRVPHDEAVFGGEGDQGMFDVTVGGPGLVAVGENDHGAPVWTSTDGIVWSQVPDDESVFSGPDVRIFDVISEGNGLVAVGESNQGATVWASRDGITWVVELDSRSQTGDPQSVIAWGPGLVAVGSDGPDAAVWTSVLDD